ncbi:exodeoxyribonuclease VII small subunit [Youngiibacter multivorans]|jgi:exodeoxyribonuclease VII small subunit|uniref:Exodeoxyribonuclease 7 small subunit n=1 Tax=Youngiibacter multivorans TaxID=937251 RepID=A0ABS4G8B1_9CLOT|nr:exodeoxyribonuclease VII small subunit [Youngiibacter multivorans]MBP1920771.1 exodeoxyribonuclease VII small subunit [Youngiibacter multivorans]
MARKKRTYKEIMEELDAAIKELENGGLPLEEAIEKYELGVKLSGELLVILEKAEEKVKIMEEDGEKNFEGA